MPSRDDAARTGEDHVARLEGEDARDVADERRGLENHVPCAGPLPRLPVHLEPQLYVIGVGDLATRDQVGDGAKPVVALGRRPRQARLDSIERQTKIGNYQACY